MAFTIFVASGIYFQSNDEEELLYLHFFFFIFQVDGLIALMESDHVGPFNLGNPGEFTMLELAEVCQ